MPTQRWQSRAVSRRIEGGSNVFCAGCGQHVKFVAKRDARWQVVCNVYEANVWQRVEHYHAECYTAAGEPHGPPSD